MKFAHASSPIIRGRSGPVVSLVSRTALVSGTAASQPTIKDVVYDRVVSATADTVQDVSVAMPFNSIGQPSFVSSNTSILTVHPSTGAVTRVADGTANVIVTLPGFASRTIPVTVSRAGGQTIDTFNQFVSGSLGRVMADARAALIVGRTAPTFDVPNASTPLADIFNSNGTRNTSGYFGNLNLSAISNPFDMGGFPITPQHTISAGHYISNTIGKTSTIYFKGTDNTVYSRGITSIASYGDVMLNLLDSPLPVGIPPMLLLPADYATYMPSAVDYPGFFTNQDRRLLLANFRLGNGIVQLRRPLASDPAYNWFYDPRQYDSGSPFLFKVGTVPVALGEFTGPTHGPNYASILAWLTSAIAASAAPSYTFNTVNLSAFPSY